MFVCERVVALTGRAAEQSTRGGFESRRLGGPAVEGEEGLGWPLGAGLLGYKEVDERECTY